MLIQKHRRKKIAEKRLSDDILRVSKPKLTFFRRLYIAYLISSGINTVPAIMAKTGMPRRTAQEVVLSLSDLGIKCEFQGANKTGGYVITDWAAIRKEWIDQNLQHIVDVLKK